MATLVKFYWELEEDQVMAYFPELKYNPAVYGNDLNTCYAHIGQHSACHEDYVSECRPAKPEEYKDLKAELESIGYKLKIIK